MPTPLRILVVEDDLSKLRAVERLLGALCRPHGGVDLTHCGTLTEVAAIAPGLDIDAVATDLEIPFSAEGAPEAAAGYAVIDGARLGGLPCVVISGSIRPADWTDRPLCRWPDDAGGWADGLGWLVETAIARRGAARESNDEGGGHTSTVGAARAPGE